MPVSNDLFSVWGSGQGTGLVVYAGGASGNAAEQRKKVAELMDVLARSQR